MFFCSRKLLIGSVFLFRLSCCIPYRIAHCIRSARSSQTRVPALHQSNLPPSAASKIQISRINMRSRRARSQALSAINRARYCSSLTTTPLTPITALLSSSSAAAAAPTHKVIPNLNLINSIPRSVSKSEIVPVVVVGKVEIVDEVVVLGT